MNFHGVVNMHMCVHGDVFEVKIWLDIGRRISMDDAEISSNFYHKFTTVQLMFPPVKMRNYENPFGELANVVNHFPELGMISTH